MKHYAYLAFLILGSANMVHGMALPFLIEKFQLSLTTAGLALLASSGGYLVASLAFPRLNHRRTARVLISLAVAALGTAFTIIPFSPIWAVLVALILLASWGTGTMELGFNTVIAGLDASQAQGAMNWLHFFYGIGALFSPFLLSRALELGFSWRMFYHSFGLVALVFLYFWQRSSQTAAEEHPQLVTTAAKSQGLFREPLFWMLQMVIFLYSACEISLAGWIATLLTHYGVSAKNASLGISALWLGIACGRAICARIGNRISPRQLLLILSGGSALVLLVFVFPLDPRLVVALVFLAGLFLAGSFPLILVKGAMLFPEFATHTTSGLMVAAALGAMTGPALLGLIGEHFSLTKGVVFLAATQGLSTILIFLLPARTNTPLPKKDLGIHPEAAE